MKYFATMLLAALVFSTGTVMAQPRGGNRGPWPDRIESYKKVRMLEALKLDEEHSVKFVTRYDTHQDVMREYDKERNELIDRLDSLARADAADNAFDEVYAGLLEIDKKIADERQNFLNQLKEILSNKQIAEYIVFERNFIRELRQAVRDVQRDRIRDH
ncbi:MAG TPA: hypothetical protein VMG34_12540 [Bacteroidota bacterium]|nr:hypothetical protein [Bacteroidota bacterium]